MLRPCAHRSCTEVNCGSGSGFRANCETGELDLDPECCMWLGLGSQTTLVRVRERWWFQ